MTTGVAKKILAVQDAARGDAYYNRLMDEYAVLDQRFLNILPTLTGEQRDAVMDYMGLFIAMHLRMLELACLMME